MQEGNQLKKMSRSKALYGFLIFLALMWLCTVISKSIYASGLPVVAVEAPESKHIEHIVEVEGIVEAGEKEAVNVPGGLRVDRLMVQTGERIEEGDALFSVDMEDLKRIIKEKETQISKLQLQIDTILHNEEIARQKKALQEERARNDYDETARYENTLVGRASNEVAKIEEEIENSGGDDEALKDALQAAAYAEADAKWARDNAVKEAGRKVEDILLPENEDSTLTGYRIELDGIQEELSLYKNIEEAEGKIAAKKGGLITDIYISEGSRTADSAVMLLADEEIPCRFKANLNREQKKYVGLNDTVSIKLEGKSKAIEASVEYLAESATMPDNYELHINLPEDTGLPGLSGSLSHTESGVEYFLCIDAYAVYKDNSNRSFVYVVKEREGILGMEYYVEQINVKVLDENENWAAVEGALNSESRIIVSSTKEIHNGDAVRF